MQSPDPILLVRGLDVLGRIIHNKSPTAAFTVSTFRHKYQLDSAPSEASVLHYCQLLTAELETLCLSGPDNKQQRLAALQVEAPPKKGQGKGVGSVARSGGNSSNPLNEDGVCKFFASSNGCRYGRSCVHHHSQLTPADNRCFNCGAEGHAMAQCERPTAKLGPKGGIPIPKMPSFPKTEGKGEAKGRPKADPKTSATPNPKAKPNPKTKRLPKGRRLGVSEEQGGAVDEGAEQREDGSWEGALKSVCIEGPHLMASLKGITLGAKSGLLDGGATHCLRFGPPGEYQQARPIEVHLASGTTQELRINAAGTLISPNPDIQPIMPMGLLTTELKCDIRWDESECVVNHPRLGPLEVTMVKNCPEVDDKVCLELIREVEELRADAMVRSVQTHAGKEDPAMGWHGMSDEEFLVSLRKWAKNTFEDVPERIQSKLAPSSNCDPAESGLNRHTRRKLERGSAFIHLFCGQQRWDLPGAPSLALDLNRGYDFLDDKLYGYLLRLGRMGCIQYLLGGPPCRTFTSLRGRGTGPDADGGPRVVRTRHGMERFGLTDLTPEEWDQVDGDTTLVLRFLVLADVSAQGLRAREGKDKSLKNPKLFFGFEHPEDPEEFLRSPETGPWPSVWAWDEMREFADRHGMYEACFHQGLLGHCKVKPTRMLLTSGYLWERLHMLKVPPGGLWRPTQSAWLNQRLRESSTWAAWAPQLVAFIKESMHDWQKGAEHVGVKDQERHFRLQQLIVAGGYDGESAAKFSMRALQGKQLEDFKRHCAAGHKPWRSDCKACLDAMAYSRPHRRMQKSRACSLSIDISGPFRSENAEDYEVPKPKYMLVGAYTFPRFSVACKEPSIPKDERIPDTDEAEALLRDEDGSPKPPPAAEGKAEESLLPDYASLFPEDPRRFENLPLLSVRE